MSNELFTELGKLEERVKKAETEIPMLKQQLADSEALRGADEKRIEELQTKLHKYESLEQALKSIVGNPSISSVAGGTMDAVDPVQPLHVVDLKEPLRAETTSLLGQLASSVLEEEIVPGKRYRVAEISDILLQNYEGKWGKGQVQETLEKMVAPPYRMFTHTIDTQKRHFFALRERARGQVSK